MTLYSYIVAHDMGFAPNPFHGVCTLACCKPVVRRACAAGDWIVGITPKRCGHKLVYAMKVEQKILFEDYWKDYAEKRADLSTTMGKCGDNIYEPLGHNRWRQHPSFHSEPKFSKAREFSLTQEKGKGIQTVQEWDLSGEYVLLAREFVYYGVDAIELPDGLRDTLPAGRGYRCNFPAETLDAWEDYVKPHLRGRQGYPPSWGEADGGCPKSVRPGICLPCSPSGGTCDREK
ncbi:MAG: hypothetical protein LBQ10_09145 [Desulfovibrio sp.]|jgi:hypothetical protein|nr:hypothetical protein [Desulfovibrio sp.]